MILYLAGGFHFSNKVETELQLGNHLMSKYGKYNRLGTFYYEKDARNIKAAIEAVSDEPRKVSGTDV